MHGCRREICVRKFKILSGVFYCRKFAFLRDLKHQHLYVHIYSKNRNQVEKRNLIMTMQFHNNMIMLMIHIFEKYGLKGIQHTQGCVLSIRYLNKILPCEKEGKQRLTYALRGFPSFFIYKIPQKLTIRNRGPPPLQDYH